ncbi:hypothetical protein ACFQL0_15355 [Haloplanus litoreus]|uniref:hypothetical protein n=1 Tax=Haloplanus litoreus TaxID=767515 RepID=UPI003619D7BF
MRNYHVPDDIVQESESFANYWHCDQHPVDAIKIFITLHDTDERHGPLHVLRGTNPSASRNSGSCGTNTGSPASTSRRTPTSTRSPVPPGVSDSPRRTNYCTERAFPTRESTAT